MQVSAKAGKLCLKLLYTLHCFKSTARKLQFKIFPPIIQLETYGRGRISHPSQADARTSALFSEELIPTLSLMLRSATIPNVLLYTELVGAPMFHNKIAFYKIREVHIEPRRLVIKENRKSLYDCTGTDSSHR